MKEVTLPQLECLRCGWKWTPRGPRVTICPKCKSPYFDKPRKPGKERDETTK